MKKTVIIIVLVISLVLGVAITLLILAGNDSGSEIAKVSSETITKGEYKYFLNIAKEQLEQLVNLSEADASEKKAFWRGELPGVNQSAEEFAKDQALRSAADFKIQLIKARENKLILTSIEKDQIKKIITDFIGQNGGQKSADQYLQSQLGMSLSAYSTFMGDRELVRKFIEFEKSKTVYTEQILKAFFDANVDTLITVTVRHILIMSKQEDTQEQKDKAKQKAEDLLARVNKGEEIGKLAKEFSDDTSSKSSNGELTFARGKMVKEFEKFAFDNEVGKTGVVSTEYGYHVVKIIDKKMSYEVMKDNVKQIYGEDEYAKHLEKWRGEDQFKLIKNNVEYKAIKII